MMKIRKGIAFVGLMALLLLTCAPAAQAMSQAEHESHHPGQGAGRGSEQGGGMMGGGMMQMMDGMMEKMGAPKPRDLYPDLMRLRSLSPAEQKDLELQATDRMRQGISTASAAVGDLHAAMQRADFAAMQAATDRSQLGLAMFESGLATQRILAEGQAPRQAALQWFKQEMGLLPPAGSPSSQGLLGMSWFHLSLMVVLVAFFLAMSAMYFFKMRRAKVLITALDERAEKKETEGISESNPQPLVDRKPTVSQKTPTSGPWSGTMVIGAIESTARGVKTFRLVVASGSALPFTYLPGQFLQVSANVSDKPVKRAYTIASSPVHRFAVEITVKREEHRAMSQHLHDSLQVGDEVHIAAPLGSFTFTETDADGIVLIAGGVGITPMMAVLRYLTDIGWPCPIILIYSCRDVDDVIFKDEIEILAQRNANVTIYLTLTKPSTGSWDGLTGRIDSALLHRALGETCPYPVHVCGPAPMMAAVVDDLGRMGIESGQIKTEAFGPAKRPDSEPNESRGMTDQAKDTCTVTFANSGKQQAAGAGQTVLDVADALQVPIDNSCRSGTCGLCKVRLSDGSVSMDCDDALDDQDRADGMILACQAVATTDVTVEA